MDSGRQSARSFVQQVKMPELQCMRCTNELVETLHEIYHEERLRPSSEAEARTIERGRNGLGFPGYTGAVDCAGWK